MAQDPKNGMVYLQLAEDTGTQRATTYVNGVATAWAEVTQDSIQASGVLIAPDEVLIAGHSAQAADGGLRTVGTATVGYDAGSRPFGSNAVDKVHVIGNSDFQSTSGMSMDYAVVHLATPVVGGTVFDLGTMLNGGVANVSGYPAGTAGAYDTANERLTAVSGYSLLTGQSLGEGGDPHGSSGGPVWTSQNGNYTVVGDVSANSNANTNVGYFKALTSADIAQIRSWMDQDHGVTSTDPVAGVAALIAGDASSRPKLAGVMTDVSTALQNAVSDGSSASGAIAAAADACDYLGGNGQTSVREIAYLAGVIGGMEGVGGMGQGLAAWVGENFEGLGNKTLKSLAAAGWNEGHAYATAHGLT